MVALVRPARMPHTAGVDMLAPESGGKLRDKLNALAHYGSESALVRLLGVAYARAMLTLLNLDTAASR
ncbi:hypothetical protein OpiT1DRAFT_05519 [Opitutaceae bacterium TAV1]|nr:hypothetical protein OPIT5_30335 [Opitutaceae bacterium TAV5]EIQ00959.1 hypothetical protein OpiT1DRAFT_05519 [Opitutaceae bacterium TAV1]